MNRFPSTLLLGLVFATVPAFAVGLPDTGQDTCYNDTAADGAASFSANSISGDTAAYPRQDCRYGNDPAVAAGLVTKTGNGAKGFDYTKISNNGVTLGAGATLGFASTDWACTRDNITGLTWEIKTASIPDLRYSNHTYSWLSSDSLTNGGIPGNAGTNTCNSTLPGNQCNTQAFVVMVNTIALCTYTDWRLPTRRELLTLVLADESIPSLDQTYFPNPPASPFWTASTFAPDATNAWFVDFADGYSNSSDKSRPNTVRLVRGPLF